MRQFVIDWVKALRSGDYKQGAGTLELIARDGITSKYCCLGVLMHTTGMPYKPRRMGIKYPTKADPTLTHEARDKFGISEDGEFWTTSDAGKCPHYNKMFEFHEESCSIALTDLNDEIGLTFDQIADVVEWTEQNNCWV